MASCSSSRDGERDAHLIALNRRLHLLHLRVLDRGGDLLRRVAVERHLELDVAAHRVAAGLLDLADVEVLHRHAALDELRLHDVEQRRIGSRCRRRAAMIFPRRA